MLPTPEDQLVEAVLSGAAGYESEVFERYAQRLMAFARTRLPDRMSSRVDSDDIVQSVFRSFFRRNDNNEFEFDESADLWRLLVAITYRKVLKSIEHHSRQRRDVTRETGDVSGELPLAMDLQPGPEQVNVMIDYLDWIVSQLPSDSQTIMHQRMEGYSIAEIAAQNKVSQRTVKRVLARVREIAVEKLDKDGD